MPRIDVAQRRARLGQRHQLASAAADPVGAARAMVALGPFEPQPHLAVAVSGGADSMALCLLVHAWAIASDALAEWAPGRG